MKKKKFTINKELKFRYILNNSGNTSAIKFRAWDKVNKLMLLPSVPVAAKEGFSTVLTGKGRKGGVYSIEYIGESLERFIVMQYTNLSNNLCQSDIIEYPVGNHYEKIALGVIEKDKYGFIVKSLTNNSSFPLRELEEKTIIEKVKIISNIYK